MNDISQILVQGIKVGLVGPKQAFEHVRAERRSAGTGAGGRENAGGNPGDSEPAEGARGERELARRLVELISENNYIAEAARDDYGKALRKEYQRFLGMDIPEESPVMEIKVFGMSGCQRCSSLSEKIIDVLAELSIVADFEHVTDLDRFAELGGVAPPVVTKNGKIISSGRTLNRARIIDILKGGF